MNAPTCTPTPRHASGKGRLGGDAMTDKAEQIAEGLSEAAKSALLMFGKSELPGGMLVVEPGDEPVVEELLHACCISDIRAAGYRFIDEQPFGLAVREILIQESQS